MEREAMIATGNTAEIFLLCDDKVLKLFRTGYSYDAVEREYENHKLISALYENVPRIFELYKNDGRYGYVMERIEGRSLASYMQCEESFKEAMEKFTALHRGLLPLPLPSRKSVNGPEKPHLFRTNGRPTIAILKSLKPVITYTF